MKRLTSLIAAISVFTATGLGYVGYKNIATSNNTKEQKMLNKIQSIRNDLKNREQELRNLEKYLNEKESRKKYLNDQIKTLEANISDLNNKDKISKSKIDKLNSDLLK